MPNSNIRTNLKPNLNLRPNIKLNLNLRPNLKPNSNLRPNLKLNLNLRPKIKAKFKVKAKFKAKFKAEFEAKFHSKHGVKWKALLTCFAPISKHVAQHKYPPLFSKSMKGSIGITHMFCFQDVTGGFAPKPPMPCSGQQTSVLPPVANLQSRGRFIL